MQWPCMNNLYGHNLSLLSFLCYLEYDAYLGNYSKSRQEFQDTIIEKFLDGTVIHDNTNGLVCKTPTEPWIVFTAGVMVRFSFNNN